MSDVVKQSFASLTEPCSFRCHVHGFAPYFFTPAPHGFTEAMCHQFRVALNQAALNHVKVNKKCSMSFPCCQRFVRTPARWSLLLASR